MLVLALVLVGLNGPATAVGSTPTPETAPPVKVPPGVLGSSPTAAPTGAVLAVVVHIAVAVEGVVSSAIDINQS